MHIIRRVAALACVVGLAVLTAALCGCGGLRTEPSGAQFDMLEEIKRTTPTCKEARECEVKWNAARNWVLNNAGWRIQTLTADYLETFNPTAHSPRIAARVTKEPNPEGDGYQILIKVWCDNAFGCMPNTVESRLSFNRYIGASWREPVATK
jgi:hypothetical protein